jgi:hypothetical protein
MSTACYFLDHVSESCFSNNLSRVLEKHKDELCNLGYNPVDILGMVYTQSERVQVDLCSHPVALLLRLAQLQSTTVVVDGQSVEVHAMYVCFRTSW